MPTGQSRRRSPQADSGGFSLPPRGGVSVPRSRLVFPLHKGSRRAQAAAPGLPPRCGSSGWQGIVRSQRCPPHGTGSGRRVVSPAGPRSRSSSALRCPSPSPAAASGLGGAVLPASRSGVCVLAGPCLQLGRCYEHECSVCLKQLLGGEVGFSGVGFFFFFSCLSS